VVHQLRIRKRGQIRAAPVFRARGEEANGAGDDGRDEEFVVGDCGAAFGVGVYVDVVVLEGGAGVVAALAGFPGWGRGLGEGEGCVGRPGGAGGFDGFEVGVGVALDVLSVCVC